MATFCTLVIQFTFASRFKLIPGNLVKSRLTARSTVCLHTKFLFQYGHEHILNSQFELLSLTNLVIET